MFYPWRGLLLCRRRRRCGSRQVPGEPPQVGRGHSLENAAVGATARFRAAAPQVPGTCGEPSRPLRDSIVGGSPWRQPRLAPKPAMPQMAAPEGESPMPAGDRPRRNAGEAPKSLSDNELPGIPRVCHKTGTSEHWALTSRLVYRYIHAALASTRLGRVLTARTHIQHWRLSTWHFPLSPIAL